MSVAAPARTALAACMGVSVSHGVGDARVDALVDVTLEIEPGSTLALWGTSGSGKTTLLHVLGGLVEPTAGSVWWRGAELSSLDVAARGRARAGGIAYVFQGSNLLPTFTAYENVAFAVDAAHEAGTDQAGDAGHGPADLLELVGLGSKLDHLPPELSGGEAQRVAMARAIGQRPALLLCDEPTGQLDSDTSARVLDLMDATHAEFDYAMVVATHDPEVAARYDRVIELDDGRVA
ncbi:MAG: putative transport system ATP-binding protein [Solirubrobacteraceae bacterium]|nr:putative transport system ATP-binding protein [Solirubrobacteraceae bacterium]